MVIQSEARLPHPKNCPLIRKVRNLTQEDVAGRLSRPVTGQYIAQIESGRRTASNALLLDLAAVLDVPAHALWADRIRIDVSSPTGVVRVSA